MLVVDACTLTYPGFSARYDLAVARGAMTAIVGPSGGGKTTLLSMIAGFETPASGSLAFDGASLLALPPAKRPVAMVFQDHNLFPHLTAFENVALGVSPALRLDAAGRARVAEALASVDLAAHADKRPQALSGGQRQRVALARALVSRKPLLLLDEPFGALDPGLRREMIGLVDALRRAHGLTVVITIHTPDDILDVADALAFVADGHVLAHGPPRETLRADSHPAIAAFMGR